MAANEGNISERLIYLVRFAGTEFSKMEPEPGAERLENLITQYVKLEGIYSGAGVVEGRDVKGWERTLGTYEKVSEILWNLEKNYQKHGEELKKFFDMNSDLKMAQMLLAGVIIRGSKLFKELGDKSKITINNDKFLEEGKKLEKEHINLIEDFLRSPLPFAKESQEGESEVDVKELADKNAGFFGKGKIAYWYLVYYLAIIQREKELCPQPELDEKEDKIKLIMNDCIQHMKGRQLEGRHGR
ncbi:MAG: hypothetical protein ACM3KR_09640 [Deltaproteobacteria bacterium]